MLWRYYILNTAIMSLKQADDILARRGRINELTQEVFDAKYQKALIEYIENKNNQRSLRQIASFVLSEFRNNRSAFSKCRPTILGLKPKIPFLMVNGAYKTGNKFLNSRDQWYAGDLIQSLVIDERFKELARYLEYTEVETMHYDDIDFEIDDIFDDDIEDLQCDFVNFFEIIKNMIDEGLISDEQITKYHLEFGVGGSDDDDDPYEEFPEKRVQNISRLKNHIRERWNQNPNPYVEKSYIQWRPKYPLAKENYSLSMYQSTFNQNKCFCQMCQRLYPLKYIERNDIERNPVYAWEQMYLNLCLTCSKDYILLRHNELLWQQFINNLIKVNVLSGGMFEIPIGNETIAFTATHLAEIQEIFKNEGWGDHAPKRKPVKGKSIDDEGKER